MNGRMITGISILFLKAYIADHDGDDDDAHDVMLMIIMIILVTMISVRRQNSNENAIKDGGSTVSILKGIQN